MRYILIFLYFLNFQAYSTTCDSLFFEKPSPEESLEVHLELLVHEYQGQMSKALPELVVRFHPDFNYGKSNKFSKERWQEFLLNKARQADWLETVDRCTAREAYLLMVAVVRAGFEGLNHRDPFGFSSANAQTTTSMFRFWSQMEQTLGRLVSAVEFAAGLKLVIEGDPVAAQNAGLKPAEIAKVKSLEL